MEECTNNSIFYIITLRLKYAGLCLFFGDPFQSLNVTYDKQKLQSDRKRFKAVLFKNDSSSM